MMTRRERPGREFCLAGQNHIMMRALDCFLRFVLSCINVCARFISSVSFVLFPPIVFVARFVLTVKTAYGVTCASDLFFSFFFMF